MCFTSCLTPSPLAGEGWGGGGGVVRSWFTIDSSTQSKSSKIRLFQYLSTRKTPGIRAIGSEAHRVSTCWVCWPAIEFNDQRTLENRRNRQCMRQSALASENRQPSTWRLSKGGTTASAPRRSSSSGDGRAKVVLPIADLPPKAPIAGEFVISRRCGDVYQLPPSLRGRVGRGGSQTSTTGPEPIPQALDPPPPGPPPQGGEGEGFAAGDTLPDGQPLWRCEAVPPTRVQSLFRQPQPNGQSRRAHNARLGATRARDHASRTGSNFTTVPA